MYLNLNLHRHNRHILLAYKGLEGFKGWRGNWRCDSGMKMLSA